MGQFSHLIKTQCIKIFWTCLVLIFFFQKTQCSLHLTVFNSISILTTTMWSLLYMCFTQLRIFPGRLTKMKEQYYLLVSLYYSPQFSCRVLPYWRNCCLISIWLNDFYVIWMIVNTIRNIIFHFYLKTNVKYWLVNKTHFNSIKFLLQEKIHLLGVNVFNTWHRWDLRHKVGNTTAGESLVMY